jgi:hypothetical protein
VNINRIRTVSIIRSAKPRIIIFRLIIINFLFLYLYRHITNGIIKNDATIDLLIRLSDVYTLYELKKVIFCDLAIDSASEYVKFGRLIIK